MIPVRTSKDICGYVLGFSATKIVGMRLIARPMYNASGLFILVIGLTRLVKDTTGNSRMTASGFNAANPPVRLGSNHQPADKIPKNMLTKIATRRWNLISLTSQASKINIPTREAIMAAIMG